MFTVPVSVNSDIAHIVFLVGLIDKLESGTIIIIIEIYLDQLHQYSFFSLNTWRQIFFT